MIFPWLKGIVLYFKAPLTWTIIGLNLFFYLLTWDSEKVERSFFNENNDLIHLGMMYSQYKADRGDQESPNKVQISVEDEFHFPNRKVQLRRAAEALKDPDFLQNFSRKKYSGDSIAIQYLSSEIKAYNESLNLRWTTRLGLNTYNVTRLNWITYQFMHASWMHVIGNMLMVLIFGGALELMIGSLSLLFIYIMGGVAAGACFLLLSAISVSPMVGASGAVSALIAFYAIFEAKRRVAFIYFVSPMPGYYGQIYLPTLLLFPLIFMPDIAGLVANKSEFGGGVAYAAHIGGAIFGIFTGLLFRYFKRTASMRWLFQH